MTPRLAPNRAELSTLALAWVLFTLAASFSPWWAALLAGIAAGAVTLVVLRAITETRLRLEHSAAAHAQLLSRALGANPALSPRDAAERAAASLESTTARAQELRRVIDALDDPVLATDPAGAITLSNAAADAFIGVNSGAAIGRSIEELLPQSRILALHAGAAQGRAGHDQVSIHRAGGKRTYQVFAAPLGSPAGSNPRAGAVVTLRDVTELAAAVRLQTDFVANASHELRTPLSSIRAAAETLETAHDDPPMVDRLTEMIRSNCTRLEELVADMLDLSRLQSDDVPLHPEPVELEALFADLRELFGATMRERRLSLAFETQEGLTSVLTEAKALRLILRNLVENSSKFAFEETQITVRTTTPAPGRVRFEVIDRGEGIPISAQSRIFERFFQADAARAGSAPRRGTGLGLAMVKQAVTRLGGTVGVESVWKEGTTMTVELPC